jgi:NAD(P)-dependent dehydrogenase (short-subunit alcohol dehydrogenase family)
MRATIPSMLRAGGGSIINIASVATPIGLRGPIPYQASKAAVLVLTAAPRSVTARTTFA